MDEKIFELLETKDFTSLSKNEQDLVLQSMTVDEYVASRLSITESIQELDNEIKQTAYDEELLEKLNEKTRKKSYFFYFLIDTKVSLLKVAAIFILFVLGYTFLLINQLSKNEVIISNQSLKMDTVFITKIKTLKKTDTVFITKTKRVIVESKRKNISTITGQELNSKDSPNLQQIYAKEALLSLNYSKNSISNGLNMSIEDSPIIFNPSISDQTCTSIDALCNM